MNKWLKDKSSPVLILVLFLTTWLIMGATVTINPVQPGTIILVTTACASGYNEVTALDGVTLRGTLAAHGNVGTTGGSDLITAEGTVSAPTFTGSSAATSSNSAGTPAGSVSAPTFTGNAVASTLVSAGTPSGSVSAPTFTGNALGTHSHGVGTYAASAPTFTGSALGTH